MNKISIAFTLEEWEVIIASLKTRQAEIEKFKEEFNIPNRILVDANPIILTIEEKINQ